MSGSLGSPPQVRVKAQFTDLGILMQGITPAGAGKSSKPSE